MPAEETFRIVNHQDHKTDVRLDLCPSYRKVTMLRMPRGRKTTYIHIYMYARARGGTHE